MRVIGTTGLQQGCIGDVPHWEPKEVVDSMEGVKLYDGVDPGQEDWQIAQAVVRGDALVHPYEAKRAEALKEDALDIVLLNDDSAKAGDAAKEENIAPPSLPVEPSVEKVKVPKDTKQAG
jgi:hypothetical protein